MLMSRLAQEINKINGALNIITSRDDILLIARTLIGA